VAVLVALPISTRAYCAAADPVFDRIAENWRWSHYWFGKTGIDDVYVEGKKISALIFWNNSESQPIRGLCSSELSLCVAYSGIYLDPAERRMSIAPNVAPQQAFTSFVRSGLRDSSHMIGVEGLRTADFQLEQKSLTLPVLGPPSSITRRAVPEEASREAEKVKRPFGCWGVESETRLQGCTGSLVFAYYGDTDPYWFVLRSCSTACEFKGESVEMLRRGDHGWDVTIGGLINSPKEEVERLKKQIEKAEMSGSNFRGYDPPRRRNSLILHA
jgi:hypothetical protein